MMTTFQNPKRLHLATIQISEHCACGEEDCDRFEEWYVFCPHCEALVEVDGPGEVTCPNNHKLMAVN